MINSNSITLAKKMGDTASKLAKSHYLFLSSYSNEKSRKVVSGNVSRFVEFMQANGYQVKDIDQFLINLYQNKLREDGLTGSTYNLRLYSLKKYLGFMGYHNLKFKTVKVEKYNNLKMVTKREIANILNNLKKLKDNSSKKRIKYLRDYLIFSLLLYTGVRKNELLQLQWKSIYDDGDDLCFSVIGKGHKQVNKVIPAGLLQDFWNLKKLENKSDHDYIFTSNRSNGNGKLSHDSLNFILNKYNKDFNDSNRKLSVHSLRNLSGSLLYESTKDIRAIQAHYGHSSVTTTEHYLRGLKSKTSNHYEAMKEALTA